MMPDHQEQDDKQEKIIKATVVLVAAFLLKFQLLKFSS